MTETQSEHEQLVTQKSGVKKQILISVSVMLFLVLGTALAVIYGKGYRFSFQQGEPKLSKTGLLHITSIPTGAQVYLDGKLATATNNTLNLTPGKYKITISKDGYNDWQKDFEIQREVVSSADAVLFRKAPTLQSISTFGVESAIMDPTATKLAFKIASNSAKRNGIYIFDMSARNFPVLAGQSSSTQLVDDTIDAFSRADITWSPDGKQLLAGITNNLNQTSYYLLQTDGFNDTPQNVTAILKTVQDTWQTQRLDKETAQIKSLKPSVQKFAKENFRILSWSPDDTKVLYQASQSGQMPVFLKPRLIGNNLLYERRDLKQGAVYVYDIKEDVNTRVIDSIDKVCTSSSPDCTCSEQSQCSIPFTWFPDSQHLIYVSDKKIVIIEHDGANMTTIYAGPFIDHYVFPWPDGSKIVILTNLNNPGVSPTLYTISLN